MTDTARYQPDAGGITRADICVIACAEAFRGDGEVMASPFGTVPALAARVAKRTFAPDLVLTDGEAALLVGAPPLAAPRSELALEANMPYRTVFAVVWSGRRHIIMMASQIDQYGNQNLSAIGDRDRPARQLVGTRGAPGNSVNHPTSYWVPDHSVRTFVAHVDVVCGVGYKRAAAAGRGATRFHEIRRVISNLGVFDFDTADRRMRLRSVHPGVTVDEVVAATGFELEIADPSAVATSRAPDDAELDLLTELDPANTRAREIKG